MIQYHLTNNAMPWFYYRMFHCKWQDNLKPFIGKNQLITKKNGIVRFLGKIIDWPNIFVLFAWKLIINLTRSWNKTQFSFATIKMVKKFSLITFLIYFIAWNWVQLLLLFHKDQKCNIYIKTLSNEYLHLMKMNHLAAFHSSYLGLWTIFYSAKLIGNKEL